jgi:hypothetical protein
MIKEPLHSKLLSLSTRLLTDTPQRQSEAQHLDQLLSRSLLADDLSRLQTSEAPNLFASEPETDVVAADTRAAEQPEFRALIREVPIQSTRLHASLPQWAAGAAIDRTIGPVTAADGRQLWFDFLRIEKLVALYIQNRSNPSLLFNVRSGIFISPLLPLSASPSTTYRLGAGSIWIDSGIFVPGPPAGNFTGLTIRGGLITLSADPQTINNKLTIAPNTIVTVELDLQQPQVTAEPTSPYGVDARDSQAHLPERLVFRFSSGGSTFTEISRASWNVFGHQASFEWDRAGFGNYDDAIHRVLLPFSCSERTFAVRSSKSPLNTLAGETRITRSAWALPSAPIDIANPTPASGIGAMLVIGGKGLTTAWRGLTDGEINSTQPYVMAEPGRLSVADQKGGNSFAHQQFRLWKDDLNRFGTSVDLRFPAITPFLYFTFADGNEAVMVSGNADIKIDRPVTVTGEVPPIRTKNSLMILSGTKTGRFISLFDDNIVSDNVDLTKKAASIPKPISLALRNALFKVSPVNGCVLFGNLNDGFSHVTNGFLYLTFGMYAYVPTLPDPYAANLGVLQRQFRVQDNATFAVSRGASISMWLVCLISWLPTNLPENDPNDKVEVSFNFAPLQNQFQPFPDPPKVDAMQALMLDAVGAAAVAKGDPDLAEDHVPGQVEEGALDVPEVPLDDYGNQWNERTKFYGDDAFALLDVSTNADLFGISFGTFGDRRLMMIRTHGIVDPNAQDSTSGFPLRAKGMDVVSQGANVRVFTVPQISWEPVFNLTPPVPKVLGEPSFGFNYYPDDGGPTRILNARSEQVALSPIPLTDFLVNSFANVDDFAAVAFFTLPWGLRALALLKKQFKLGSVVQNGTSLSYERKDFDDQLTGARQLELEAGESSVEGESNLFVGCTVQDRNVVELDGSQRGNSTLGRSVTKIFNREFMPRGMGDIFRQRGVPLTQISLSGYGATTFSHWVNPKATIAATSQTKFDVMLGRCAHEVIQVKSIMYPWGIRVVRTITLTRTNTNYVYRYDSGWQPESDGKFDFSYYANEPSGTKLVPSPRETPYEIHPGIVKGLFNVRDIRETGEIKPFQGPLTFATGDTFLDEVDGTEHTYPATPSSLPKGVTVPSEYELQPVYFTADVEIENPVTGFVIKQVKGVDTKLVPAKGILGFVQLAPRGMPIPVKTFSDLVKSQMGSIGGPIDTLIHIGDSDQEMRLNRFDFNNSFDLIGKSVFAAAGRGNVVLPKDGSWSLVKHEGGTGNVSPVPQDLSVPLIRIGRLRKPKTIFFAPGMKPVDIAALVRLDRDLVLDLDPKTQLLRIANPTELLRNPVPETINYGFLHSTDTQKALFLTPAFRTVTPANQSKTLLSRTPPLFADAFRLVNSKAVFPNIKDAFTNFGEAIALITDTAGNGQFKDSGLKDAGKAALELMEIQNAQEAAYKLAKQAEAFPLPDKWDLINVGSSFRIYIDYKGATNPGRLNFDINSAAGAVSIADAWRSRMSNVAIKVDLGPFQPLLTIKGNWDARKGSEASFGGGLGDEVPRPEIVLSEKLEKVMWILEILQDISGENYADAVRKGVRLAMSNKAGSWEYKFEAAKEIPVLRFPPGPLYDSPQTPFKLEAGLKLGAYFNAALQIETDKKQVLPSAGAYFGFYGRVSVMCVSLELATVYAVGQANLDFGADTKAGPFLRMKFGFGAQIVVGLPVIANVSVLYMVGIEIYLDQNTLEVSAFLLFSGHADILSGLVSVTITIEAKGTVVRDNANSTSLAAQVTFALDITVFWVIDIHFEESWEERRQIAGSLIG